MAIEKRFSIGVKSMHAYVKKTHNKFIFLFKFRELKEIEKKLGMKLNWTRVSIKDTIPEHLQDKFIILDMDRWHFAEIEKNEKNLKFLQKKLNKGISYEKDCLKSEGLW